MKIIHCADLHLDSKLDANLNKEKAKQRRTELLASFERLVKYAADSRVEAILISGDLFDSKHITATARNTVLHIISQNPGIRFYYLKGNHDEDNVLCDPTDQPENLLTFGETWTCYSEDDGRIVISGLELSGQNSGSAYNSLVLDSRRFNIVMLHGQKAESATQDRAEVIGLKALRNHNIDYLALGHVHAYSEDRLDGRGRWCYPGCLEGRGFDECGEHGFVLLDIDSENGTFTDSFIPFAKRRLHTVEVDVTGCMSTAEMLGVCRTAAAQAGCSSEDLVKIVLKGTLDVETEKDTNGIVSILSDEFFFCKLYDETTLSVNVTDYRLDESLKGEFVRTVLDDESLSEEDKNAIIRYGLQAIAGEEIN